MNEVVTLTCNNFWVLDKGEIDAPYIGALQAINEAIQERATTAAASEESPPTDPISPLQNN